MFSSRLVRPARLARRFAAPVLRRASRRSVSLAHEFSLAELFAMADEI
jgi:hypothetical protein